MQQPFPIREAEKLLQEEWGVESLPVKPIEIATRCGIACQEMPSSEGGVSGMLIQHGRSFGILYATHIPVVGFQHFSVAHELGHYWLPKHPENVFTQGVHQSNSGFSSDDKYEKEADQFACGLLMPSYLFDPELDKAGTGMDAIIHLRQLCGTSLTATAIRYAQRNSEPTAVVVSKNGIVEYCFMSHELKYASGINFLRKGMEVPRGTKTKAMTMQKVAACDRAEGNSDLVTWFKPDKDADIYEEVIGLGSYGRTLTVLSCESLPDAEEEREEEELKESWTPKFRR